MSRGLGDVYKRQIFNYPHKLIARNKLFLEKTIGTVIISEQANRTMTVFRYDDINIPSECSRCNCSRMTNRALECLQHVSKATQVIEAVDASHTQHSTSSFWIRRYTPREHHPPELPLFCCWYPCTIYEKGFKGRYSLNKMTEETRCEWRSLFGTENKISQDLCCYK